MMYRIAAVLLLIIFYVIYYGKVFIQKKQGIRTNQIGKQKRGRERTIAILMSIATLLVPVAEVVSICLNTSLLPEWARILGIILGYSGNIIFFLAVVHMGDSWRAGVSRDEKTKLITGGIYSISRNPAFLGFDLAYIGVLFMFFNWWLLLFTVFAMVTLHLQIILVEEPYLPVAFGNEYIQYSRKVCRYLGRKS